MKNVIVVISLFCLIGCSREGWEMSQREVSELKYEEAEIVQLSFVPSKTIHSTGMSYNMNDGSLGLVGTTGTSNEIWAVVFKCHDHKKAFALDDKNIYDQSKVGDIVTLAYVDEMIVSYVNHNNQWEVTGSKIVDQHTKGIKFNDQWIQRGR